MNAGKLMQAETILKLERIVIINAPQKIHISTKIAY